MRRALLLVGVLGACDVVRGSDEKTGGSKVDRPGEAVAQAATARSRRPADVRPTPPLPPRFGGIGRAASAAEIRAWDIDANASGVGLPPGRGTYTRGAVVYARSCASCHGARGEGIAPNPRLVGADPKDFSFARDQKAVKTIGNYWPYATTVYDYVNRAMPFDAPGSLSAPDVYSLVAFLLAENGVIDSTASLDATTLPRVRMPARDRFRPDDRIGGVEFK
jgi:cytochrome c